MERLDGKRIIVTGGTSGMGEGIVRAFPSLGAKVVFWGRNEEAGKKIEAETGAIFVKADVADKAVVDEAMAKSVELLGGIDVLIHAAGVAPHCPADMITLDSWKTTLSINATGTFLTNEAVFPYFKETGGNIIKVFTSIEKSMFNKSRSLTNGNGVLPIAERIVPIGFALSCPAISGAEP